MSTVVDLPTVKEGSNRSVEQHINGFASNVIRAWGTKSPIYLDKKRHASDLEDALSRSPCLKIHIKTVAKCDCRLIPLLP